MKIAIYCRTSKTDQNPENQKIELEKYALAEFERSIIRERTLAGLERARAQGKKLGRPRKLFI